MMRSSPSLPVQRLPELSDAVSGAGFSLVAEVHQGGHVPVDLKDDAAAPAAVAAVGSACRHILLPVEGHRAVSAVAGADGDLRGINKLRHRKILLFSFSGRTKVRPYTVSLR